MRYRPCTVGTAHGPHEWYWRNIFRRDCPGLVVAPCGHPHDHGPHWHGEHHDELCHGVGLAAICEHNVQMLNQCDDCTADQQDVDNAT